MGTTTTSILYTWAYNNTGGSIWSAVFLHWLHTYALDTLAVGMTPPPADYQWLQYVPHILIAVPIALGYAVAGIHYLLAGRPADVFASFTVTTFLGTVLNHLFRGLLGEEAGWRGFALPRLQARHGALKPSLILGTVVVVWHIPTFFIQGLAGTALLVFVVSFVVALMSFAVVMTWLYNHTGGSLLLAVLMHLGFNVVLTLSVVPLENQIAILAGLCFVLALTVTLIAGPDRLLQESGET